MNAWSPSESDLAWQRNCLEMIRDGGVWVSPNLRAIFKVSHTDRTLTLLDDWHLADPEGLRRVRIVCGAIGWQVVAHGSN